MNKTKKLTQGAMMLAILGALIVIDRLTAFWFSEFVVLVAPLIIIMYSAMQSFKDGLLLSIGIIIISFLLGNFQTMYLIYIPVGVVTGLVYSYLLLKGFDKNTLLFSAIVTYAIGEILASYVIYPLLGFPVASMIEELRLSLQGVSLMGMDYTSIFTTAGFDFNKILVIMYLISTIIMGAMEGILIHLLSVFLLKRFKVMDLGRINIWEIKPNKVLSYVCFALMFVFFFQDKITNETLYYILITLAILGCVVLLYYGYLFICCYQAIVLKKNLGIFIVLLCVFVPVLLVALMILGFLYGAGPLRQYLEARVNKLKHE